MGTGECQSTGRAQWLLVLVCRSSEVEFEMWVVDTPEHAQRRDRLPVTSDSPV